MEEDLDLVRDLVRDWDWDLVREWDLGRGWVKD